jgi:hypothetical protein
MKGRKMQMHEGKTGDSDAMSEGKGLRRTFRGFLKRNSLLFAHGGDDGDEKIFTFIESGRNLRAKVTVGDLNIVLRGAILVHQIEESIVNVDKLVFGTSDIGDIHVVRGRTDIFQFLAGEDIDGDKVNFGMSMLTGLRGRHVHDLAGATLDNDVTVFAKGRALHRVGEGGPGTDLLKGLVMLFVVVRHGWPLG